MLGVAMVTSVTFTAVLEHHLNSINPGLVGLAISYALSVTNLLSGVVTSFTEIEKQMVSVERMGQYINGVSTEKQDGIKQHDDELIWNAIRRCHMGNVVEQLGGLEAQVHERGKAFSVGEQQVFCLATALLRKSKIVCLDEVTANVDLRMSSAILETIRT